MSIIDKLAEQGIRVRKTSLGDQKMVCPECGGGRNKEHSLSVTIREDEAVWTCHRASCDFKGNVTEETPASHHHSQKVKLPPVRPSYRPEEAYLPATMADWFAKRGISEDTLRKNHVAAAKVWMPGVDGDVTCIAFPYMRDGEVINVKYRDHQKHFRQEKGAEKILYGMDNVPVNETTLIWCEGEMDLISLNEAGFWNVVSIPDGAPSKVKDELPSQEDDTKFEYIWNCHEFIGRFTKHIIAVDNDSPGKALEEELARRLGKEICWRVTWPDGANDLHCKDANDVLVNLGPESLRNAIASAKPYPVQSLYETEDFRADVIELYRGGRKKGVSTGFRNVDNLYTVRPGELTIVTGYPSSGKSEFVDAMAVNMAMMHEYKFALCSFENPPDEHTGKWAEKYLGLPFNDGPTQRMNEQELHRAIDWITKHLYFIRADEEAPTIDWVLEKARIAVLRYGINGLILDPYNEFEHKRPPGMTETEYVSKMLGQVKRFAQNYGVHVWFVAHPAKPLKDRQDEPPTLYDISGAAHWNNKADVGIAVHRPFLSDGTRDSVAQVHVKKVRFRAVGQPGIAKLEFVPTTGRYREVE